MEIERVNTLKTTITTALFQNVVWFSMKPCHTLGASPDRFMSCLCCGRACIEIKCPYSVNHTEPNEQNLDYLYEDEEAVKLK